MFEVSLMGSMPRGNALLKAVRDVDKGRMSREEYDKMVEEATEKVVKLQDAYDVDYITCGELSRDITCPLSPAP